MLMMTYQVEKNHDTLTSNGNKYVWCGNSRGCCSHNIWCHLQEIWRYPSAGLTVTIHWCKCSIINWLKFGWDLQMRIITGWLAKSKGKRDTVDVETGSNRNLANQPHIQKSDEHKWGITLNHVALGASVTNHRCTTESKRFYCKHKAEANCKIGKWKTTNTL